MWGPLVFFSQPKWGNSESRDWEGEEAPAAQGTQREGTGQALKGEIWPCTRRKSSAASLSSQTGGEGPRQRVGLNLLQHLFFSYAQRDQVDLMEIWLRNRFSLLKQHPRIPLQRPLAVQVPVSREAVVGRHCLDTAAWGHTLPSPIIWGPQAP